MRRSGPEVCFALMGVMFMVAAVCAQDAPGMPDEVAAELAAVAAWEASPVCANAPQAAPSTKTMATVFFSDFMASTVVNHAGWYIDDVMVDGAPVPVELQSISVD